jgi:hypothetical protein
MQHPLGKDLMHQYLQPKHEVENQQIGLESPKHRIEMILPEEPIEGDSHRIIDRRLEKSTT